MDGGWNMMTRRLRFYCGQLFVLCTFACFAYVWFNVLQPYDITQSNISMKELRRNDQREHPILQETTPSDVARSGGSLKFLVI